MKTMDSTAKTIWIDCDPGADDALGILLLAASGISIGGIVSCFGNGPSETTAENATKILRLAGRTDIPVFTGASQPLLRTFTPSMLYCGADGLCETGLEPDHALMKKGSFIPELKRSAGKVTWLVTGALTNIAGLLQNEPECRNIISEIVTASGCFGLTEFAKRSEWNIEIDPDAAKTVYESGIPIRAIGLDVTGQLQNVYTEQLIKGVSSNKIRQFLADCTRYNRNNGLSIYSLLNDAMTAAVILCPELARFCRGYAEVYPDRKGTGMMSFRKDISGNVQAAQSYDFSSYLSLLLGKLNILE